MRWTQTDFRAEPEQAKPEQNALSSAQVQAKHEHFVYMASQAQAADTQFGLFVSLTS